MFRSVAASRDPGRFDLQSLRAVVGTLVDDEFCSGDPNATRLFFGPDCPVRFLKGGCSCVYQFLMPFVQVGVTHCFDWRRHAARLRLRRGRTSIWITPKLQVLDHRGRTQVAVGGFHAFVDGENVVSRTVSSPLAARTHRLRARGQPAVGTAHRDDWR